MQIVIDIPKEKYDLCKKWKPSERNELQEAVANGIPLPKGHGRLIDADEAIKTLESLGNRDYRREKGTIREAEKMLSYDEYTPTIIEADKADQEAATR